MDVLVETDCTGAFKDREDVYSIIGSRSVMLWDDLDADDYMPSSIEAIAAAVSKECDVRYYIKDADIVYVDNLSERNW